MEYWNEVYLSGAKWKISVHIADLTTFVLRHGVIVSLSKLGFIHMA